MRRAGLGLGLALASLFLACATEPPPNILLIVVDTLRFDHLGTYGYERPTSPEIDSRLAARGVVVESAYSQAPWTLPSMASMHTGRRAEELLDAKGQPFGIPEPAATLAEELKARGYTTAAFIANPTLHQGNGFAQGFDTFETAPYELASMARHAEDINARALPYLRQLQQEPRRPFFLYLHYLDPHDPYDNTEIVDGKSPYFPDYQGNFRGTDVHGLYLGALQMADPQQDLEQIKALYDSEVHYVDRHIGEILAALPEAEKKRTLIVLTADHGEELWDHGGFKHGETLYEELIHVPLIFRWDGHLPAGKRLEGTVRLLDLWPTLLAAAGPKIGPAGAGVVGEPPEARPREGIDLLPALRGGKLEARPAFARHFAGGPLRLAWVAEGRKEILFDREAKLAPDDERDAYLWQRDVARMRRHEIYDLKKDPHERDDLAQKGDPGKPQELLADLDTWLAGVRILTADLEGCSQVEAEIELVGTGLAAKPLFLAAEDRFELEDNKLVLHFRGEKLPKGILLQGALERAMTVEATCDGQPLPVEAGGQLAKEGPYELRAFLIPKGEQAIAGKKPALFLWLRRPATLLGLGSERDEETKKRLKALGYAG